MKKILTIMILAASISLMSCNSALSKKYNTATMEQDMKAIGESKSISDDDKKLLAAYMMLAQMGGKNLEGETYSQILDDAKKMKEERSKTDH
jgi:thioredoxin-related protein